MVAMEFKRTPFAELLVERGADLDAIDEHRGATALLQLLSAPQPSKGAREAALWLIEQGADLNIVTEFGYTALHYAARINDPELSKRLLAEGARYQRTEAGGPLVHCMDSRGYGEVLWELLLEAGADVDETFGNENLLMTAGLAANVEGVRWLIEKGADADRVVEGRSARQLMESLGYWESARAMG